MHGPADRDRQGLAVGPADVLGDRLLQASAHDLGLAAVGAGEQDRELVAAPAEDGCRRRGRAR